MRKCQKVGVVMTAALYRSKYLPDGGVQWLPYWRIAMAIKMASEVPHLLSSPSIEIN
jgi:hypothetical protein